METQPGGRRRHPKARPATRSLHPCHVMCNCFAFGKALCLANSDGAQGVCMLVAAASPAVTCRLLAAPVPAPTHLFHCKRENSLAARRGNSCPCFSPPLSSLAGSGRCLGSHPGRAPAAARFHISFGSWWGKPNPSAGVSLDLTYRVGYICGEAVRSIPRSFSLFSPFQIYPTGSSPHTKTHLDLGTAEQRVNSSPTEQLSCKRKAGNETGGKSADGLFPQQLAFCM